MAPLIVLLSAFLIASLIFKIQTKEYHFSKSARIAMAVMLCFTAIAHFAFTKGMAMMIPSFLPFKITIVWLTGFLEILLGVGLLIPKYRKASGLVLILFLILMLPANIYAAVHNVNYQEATFYGHGLAYLWFRIPLQILFILWVYLSAVKK